MTAHERAREHLAELRLDLEDMALPATVRRSRWLTPPQTVAELTDMHLDALERAVAAHEALPDAPPPAT